MVSKSNGGMKFFFTYITDHDYFTFTMTLSPMSLVILCGIEFFATIGALNRWLGMKA